jgi:hypothetical protein
MGCHGKLNVSLALHVGLLHRLRVRFGVAPGMTVGGVSGSLRWIWELALVRIGICSVGYHNSPPCGSDSEQDIVMAETAEGACFALTVRLMQVFPY